MAFSGAQVTRLGLGGGLRAPYGSFAGKAVLPPVFAGTVPDISLVEGAAAVAYDIGAYFTGATSYSIVPAVESGWTFNTSTGVLTVDPDTVGTFGTYVVTATNVAGTADTNAFGVTVTASSTGPAGGGKRGRGGGYIDLRERPAERREREKRERDARVALKKKVSAERVRGAAEELDGRLTKENIVLRREKIEAERIKLIIYLEAEEKRIQLEAAERQRVIDLAKGVASEAIKPLIARAELDSARMLALEERIVTLELRAADAEDINAVLLAMVASKDTH